jgi:hypothetical protein
MKRVRWLFVSLVVLLLATGSMAAWAYAHHAYPYAVEFRQARVTFRHPGPPLGASAILQNWFDPLRGNVRLLITAAGYRGDNVIHAGRSYDAIYPAGHPANSPSAAWIFWMYQHGCGENDGVTPSVPSRPVGAVTFLPYGPYGLLGAKFVCERSQRLAPNTLPADFFEPPHRQRSLWDRLTGWLQAQLSHR